MRLRVTERGPWDARAWDSFLADLAHLMTLTPVLCAEDASGQPYRQDPDLLLFDDALSPGHPLRLSARLPSGTVRVTDIDLTPDHPYTTLVCAALTLASLHCPALGVARQSGLERDRLQGRRLARQVREDLPPAAWPVLESEDEAGVASPPFGGEGQA